MKRNKNLSDTLESMRNTITELRNDKANLIAERKEKQELLTKSYNLNWQSKRNSGQLRHLTDKQICAFIYSHIKHLL